MQKELFGSFHAEYESWEENGAIYLVDIGHNHTRSVTNDAEHVVFSLVEKYGPLNDRLIFYRDSSGRWDRILTITEGAKSRDTFCGFAPTPKDWKEPKGGVV